MTNPFLTNPDGSTQIRNAQFYRDNTVDCEVNHSKLGWIPFLATPYDSEKHGRDLHKELTVDRANEVAPVDLDALTEEDARRVRSERDALLSQSDWTQLGDVDPNSKQAWSVYRQELRDIPQQEGFPETVNWPVKPQ